MGKLNKNKKVILGVAVVSMVIFLLYRMGKRKVGYWKYLDSQAVYYSGKSGDIIAFQSPESFNAHRLTLGQPQDFTGIEDVKEPYENFNKYYKKGDAIVDV